MPHVDEGTIHALLDGALRAEEPARAGAVQAHLEACPDCRALLDEAAALRAGAADVLGLLEPVAHPDFQEVLTRAGAAGTHPDRATPGRVARSARTTRGLAWAATIILALGTGYLIRDRLVPERAELTGAMQSTRPILDTRSERTATAAEAADAVEVAEVGEPEAPGMQPQAGARTRPRAGTGQADMAGAERMAAEDVAPLAVQTPALEAPVAPVAPVATGQRREEVTVAPAAALRARGTPLSAERVAARPPEGAVVLRSEAVEAGAGMEVWEPVALEAAVLLMEGSLFVLDGAEIVQVMASATGVPPQVRTLQRLEGDVEVVVSQRVMTEDVPPAGVPAEQAAERAAADAEASPGAAGRGQQAGMNSVTSVRDRHVITVQGSLPREVLQALAAGARPAGDGEPAGRRP
jgi:hypothetical protein